MNWRRLRTKINKQNILIKLIQKLKDGENIQIQDITNKVQEKSEEKLIKSNEKEKEKEKGNQDLINDLKEENKVEGNKSKIALKINEEPNIMQEKINNLENNKNTN